MPVLYFYPENNQETADKISSLRFVLILRPNIVTVCFIHCLLVNRKFNYKSYRKMFPIDHLTTFCVSRDELILCLSPLISK